MKWSTCASLKRFLLLLIVAVVVAVLLPAWPAPSQSSYPVRELAATRFLVARRELRDPNFAHTVILLVDYDDEEGAMGLIINRPTKVPLSRLFQELEPAKGLEEPVYVGGPVAPIGVLALLRSRTKPDGARHVFDDIYLISTRESLEKAMEAGVDTSELRIYAGYSGWAAGQLDVEVRLGSWHIFNGDPGAVFDSEPGTLWERLIQHAELRIARSG